MEENGGKDELKECEGTPEITIAKRRYPYVPVLFLLVVTVGQR